MSAMADSAKWQCPKCDHQSYGHGQHVDHMRTCEVIWAPDRWGSVADAPRRSRRRGSCVVDATSSDTPPELTA